MENQQNEFKEKIQRNIAATEILNNVLTRYEEEMSDQRSSLSIAIYDMIVFSYQGVRMYGTLMNIDSNIPKRIIEQIKLLLLPERAGV